MARKGRKPKITPEIIRAIAQHIYPAGNYFEVACELAGITSETGYEWLRIGEGRKSNHTGTPTALFSEFSDAVHKANADVENSAIIHWRTAFENDWHASAEYLARRFPERWKKTERHEMTGPGGQPIQTEEVVLSDDERAERIAELLERARARRDRQAADHARDGMAAPPKE